MSKKIKNPLLNSKLKAIVFFLLLATTFWILTKFSREYTATAIVSLNYVNVPKTTLVTADNPKELTFDLSATGFEFLFYKLKKPVIDIDVKKYFTVGMEKLRIPKNDIMKLISSELKSSLTVKDLSVELLEVDLDAIVARKVPVKMNLDFTYKDGFKPTDSIRSIPDSILIAGPSGFLDTIKVVETRLLKVQDLDESISMDAEIQQFDNLKISYSPDKVKIAVEVSEFSQKEMVIPVEIVNIPEETIIKLIPNVVTITFNAPIENFKEISTNDFKLICDYSLRDVDENFMIPKLVESPQGILNTEFDTKRIDYLIFK